MPSSDPKLCECGCGEPTPIATKHDPKRGYVKGQPRRFANGHNNRKPVADRFWAKVDRQGPDDCWEWQGATSAFGHGDFPALGQHAAHRVSYLLNVGPIPPGLFVLHRCDNPPCVNPAHLEVGTQLDNQRQMVARGRSAVGERHGSASMTAAMVREARNRARGGEPIVDMADEFGVHRTTLREAVRGMTWRHLPGAVAGRKRRKK